MQTENTIMDIQPNPHPNPIIASVCSFISMCSAVIAWVKLQDVQVVAAITASIVAVITGLLGGWNMWLSIQEKLATRKTRKIKTP